MFDFQIKLGGIVFNINSEFKSVKDFFSDFLVNGEAACIEIMFSEEDIINEWKLAEEYSGDDNSVQRIWFEPILERKAINRKLIEILLLNEIVLVHGVAISNGSEAYLFTAPSGTGKTTRANLFIEQHPEYFILNGDKPLIRVERGRIIVCGSPWKGKEGVGINSEATLKAIFFLDRAENTKIIPISIKDAFELLVKQVYIPKGDKDIIKTLHLLKSFDSKVKFFLFHSQASGKSIEEAIKTADMT